MMVFGGLTAVGPYSDLNTVRVLIDANGIGTPQWLDLTPGGTLPPPRSELQNIAYDPINNRLIIFGGYRGAGNTEYNDTWVLTNANGLGGAPEWQLLTPPSALPSSRHSLPLSYDPNSNRLIVFGGLNQFSEHVTYNDSWVLTGAHGLSGTPTWIQLKPTGPMPLGRRSHIAAYNPRTNRFMMGFGEYDAFANGSTTSSTIFNDLWVLSNASGLCTAGQPCTFQTTASDPDAGDTLTYALDTAPAGMTIDAATGAMTWTPALAQIGDHPVTVRVTDTGGLTTTQSFTATVASVAVPNLVGLAPEWAASFIDVADLTTGTQTSQGGAITLNFDSLPSRQGWRFWIEGGAGAPSEDSLFRVSGEVLFQDTIGMGGLATGYEILSGVDPRLPLSVAVRARVTAEEGGTSQNHFGFGFVAWTGSSLAGNSFFGVGLGTDVIMFREAPSNAFDNIAFHDYVLRAYPGAAADLVVDGNLVLSSPPSVYPEIPFYDLYLGDVTAGPNARAEVTAYSFTQPRVVGQNPPAGTLTSNQTAVDLTIVEGPATETVPNLTGLTQAQANAAILAANLTVGASSSAPSVTVPADQVSDQSPLPNIHVPKNTPVNLVLSTGPPTSTNHAPTITSTQVTTVTVGQPYAYDVDATDPDAGDTLTFSLPTAPAGMTLDPASGLIEWTPTEAHVGDQTVIVRVTDVGGLSDEQPFTITVEPALPTNQPPVISFAGIAPQWTQLVPTGTTPTPRAHSRSGYDVANDRLIVFGGEEVGGTKLNEVWVLVNAKGIAGAPSWVQLTPSGTLPTPRSLSAVAYDPTANRLIIYGGCTGNCGSVLNDAWVLTNANGLGGAPEWIQLPSGTPSAWQGAAYDPISNRLMVFGGLTQPSRGSETNAVRVLVDANGIGDPRWVDLAPTGTLPSPRSLNQDLGYDLITNRLIVFGGLSGSTTEFNDTWVLTNANGLGGAPAWQQLSPTGVLPSSRSSLPVSYDPNSNRLILFGGINHFVDVRTYDDSWILTHANGLGGSPEWRKLDVLAPLPAARRAYVSAYDPKTNRLVAALGESFTQGVTTTLNDTWLLSTASGLCTTGQLCTFQTTANDPDAGDTLTYALDTAPAGMTIDAATGAMTWTPTLAQIGDHPVTVRVTDTGGLTTTQSFTATVASVAVPNLVGLAPEWAASFIGAADLTTGTQTSQGGAITLNFNSLPSRQGWTYFTYGTPAPEAQVFSLASGVFSQDSLTVGFAGQGTNRYVMHDTVDVRLPFSLFLTARVLAEEGSVSSNNFGFAVGALTTTHAIEAGFGTTGIQDISNVAIASGVDNTTFHSFRLDGAMGIGYRFFTDDNLVASGPTVATGNDQGRAHLLLGDNTGGTNARAEVTAFSFTQPRVVGQNPPAGTLTQNQTAVDLTIVDGPATETVPNLTGLTQTQASAAILAAHLTVGVTRSAPSVTVPADQVSDQSPLPNIHVPKNTPVNLVLSTGPPASTNHAPTITSTQVTTATVGQPYAYDVDATDPDTGDTLTFSLPTAPAGMTIDPASGLIEWTPTTAQIGNQAVTVRVTDSGGLSDEQPFTVTVSAADNQAPGFTSTPITTATVGQPYTYDVDATDPDGDPLTYALTTAPAGMTINPTTGAIQWTPATAQTGNQAVAVRVEDGQGGFAVQNFTIAVSDGSTNAAPEITSTPPTGATVDQLYLYAVQATDPDGDPLTFALTTAPTGMVIDPTSGLIEWTPTATQTGDHPVTVTVTDGRGESAGQSFMITVPAGVGTITVPEVIGATPTAAETTLVNAGLSVGATAEVDNRLTLDVTALPSTQLWAYGAFGNTAPETQVFTLTGGVLQQNTMGLGVTQGINVYQRAAGVHPTLPFVLTVTARVLQQEGDPTDAFGFAFGLIAGNEQIGIGLRTDGVLDAAGTVLSRAIDTTQFHTYRLEGASGSGYRLFVDGLLGFCCVNFFRARLGNPCRLLGSQ